MFSSFNFSSIFSGGSADPICPYVRTPMSYHGREIAILVCCGDAKLQRRAVTTFNSSDAGYDF